MGDSLSASIRPNPHWCYPHRMTTALDQVREAYADRDMLTERLARQNAIIPEVVRRARAEGHAWSLIAAAAGVSEVAAYNASRRDA